VDLNCVSHDVTVDRRPGSLESVCADLESLHITHADTECDDHVATYLGT
jgi:hypothetical protein